MSGGTEFHLWSSRYFASNPGLVHSFFCSCGKYRFSTVVGEIKTVCNTRVPGY